MKLLLDENLSQGLVLRLTKAFPESQHVDNLGLRGRSDLELWDFASINGFVIVSKDNDFRQLSFLRGHPPKVVWLSVGDAGTDAIATLLMAEQARILAFDSDGLESLLVLEGPHQGDSHRSQ